MCLYVMFLPLETMPVSYWAVSKCPYKLPPRQSIQHQSPVRLCANDMDLVASLSLHSHTHQLHSAAHMVPQ